MNDHVDLAAVDVDPPTPFLPDSYDQWCWDSTSLGWFKACPRLYQYRMIEGWRPRQISVHLEFGLIYHSALERYDHMMALGTPHLIAMGMAVRHAMERSWDTERNAPRAWDDTAKTRENLIRTIVWYLEQFENDGLQTVILANGRPAVELSFKVQLDNEYWLSGHIDRLVRFQDQVYVCDRKTTKTTPGQYYMAQYEPHNQMSLYTLASQLVYGLPAQGVIIDVAQIAVGFSRFERGMTYRTKEQLNEWIRDFRWHVAAARQYAEAGYWPMNDMSCTMYGRCVFQPVCSKSHKVRENFLATDFVNERWNPLANRGEKL